MSNEEKKEILRQAREQALQRAKMICQLSDLIFNPDTLVFESAKQTEGALPLQVEEV